MQETLICNGAVLSVMAIGEADRRLLLLTKEMGKISCFARGARKVTSPFVGKTRPFSFGKFEIYPGRDSYSLHSAEIREYFDPVVRDPVKSALGSCFLELVSQVAQENTDGTKLLRLLYYALRAAENGKMEPDTILTVFQAKLLQEEGALMEFENCAKCGKPLQKARFLPSYMNVLCEECVPEDRGIRLSPGALHALRFLERSDEAHLFSFNLEESVKAEVASVVKILLSRILPKPLLAEELFRQLIS